MVSVAAMTEARRQHRRRQAWRAAANVPDPEIPCVTIADLGILRDVDVGEDGRVVATLTPTYSGCPATQAIEAAVRRALEAAGFKTEIRSVLSPAWTTDWITPAGREKLRAFGIAPPIRAGATIRARAHACDSNKSRRTLFCRAEVPCPRCGSGDTERVSEFGSTPCKAHYRCRACAEPFDHFKCH